MLVKNLHTSSHLLEKLEVIHRLIEAQERIPREPKESREVTLRQSRTKEVKNDDLWDVPGAAVGTFEGGCLIN